MTPTSPNAIDTLAAGLHHDPHAILGKHSLGRSSVIRVMHPDATRVEVVIGKERFVSERIHVAGIYEAKVPRNTDQYLLDITVGDHTYVAEDPYRFSPVLGELDLHLFNEGRHHSLWKVMGAHIMKHEGAIGTSFAVWAPNAKAVRVVGDFNQWDGRRNPMRSLGASGIWDLFIPNVATGAKYKFEIVNPSGRVTLKTDPFAFQMEEPPKTAAVVTTSTFEWSDGKWIEERSNKDILKSPISVYECHLGSWKRGPNGEILGYRDVAPLLAEHLTRTGFTHIEFLPIAEHPFGGSWGYQVSAYFAPSSRFGTPDDFRYLVDHLHANGIGVIVDWVPAHFPRDEFALAKFDGTALYEHLDPKKGEHPDWGTLIFNFGRNEVKNFLLSNALYWIEEFHIDGIRVDAVASMLYLDYSRSKGEWVPNEFGGRENLEAIDFLKDLNVQIHGYHPGVMTIAEESTAWPNVSRPTYVGGLGFTLKWNLGWMHDTLAYFSHDPIHRKYHHNQLTFGLLYAFQENFMLPISHDEVVHGKGSLLNKMPGDEWQKMANLRSLYAWMWAHPGKNLLFMGGEFAQTLEWNHDEALSWHLLKQDQHRGIYELVTKSNSIYRSESALWESDFHPDGFRWVDANDSDNNVLSFLRRSSNSTILCVSNFSPVPRDNYRVGVPSGGSWELALNTDAKIFGGSDFGMVERYQATDVAWHGFDRSLELSLPPLGVIWLKANELPR